MMTDHEHPIAAPATALVRSALSIVRCSGAGSVEQMARIFDAPVDLNEVDSHTVHHGILRDGHGGPVDDVMVSVFRSPNSYTGEDSVEVYGHGSPAGVRRILEALYSAGFHPAAPGEFTRRAFLNGKIDLTRAEAVNDLINAQTVHAHKLALGRLSGSIQKEVSALREDLVGLMAGIAVQLDYPEEDSGVSSVDVERVREVQNRALALAGTYDRGLLVQDGISVAIAGRTNAGKSSLFNALLRQDRSIVSDTAGTTRDYLEATVDIGGMPVRLFDTAGVRTSGHRVSSVETEGIRRSGSVVAAADLVLYVVDGTEGISSTDTNWIADSGVSCPIVIVWNKSDLGGVPAPKEAVVVSALTGGGLPELNGRIVSETAAGAELPADAVIIDSARQHHLLERTAVALEQVITAAETGVPVDAIAVDLQDAIDAIGEITGEVTTDEVLDTMFGSFCLGK